MLILSRKLHESIMIGDEIEIVVARFAGDAVKIGINAPEEVTVHRREVFDAIQRRDEG